MPSSSYEDVVASLILISGFSLIALFLSNNRVFPITQREPSLVGLSNFGHTLLIAMWLFEARHENIPYIERKIVSQLCFGLIIIPFFVRAWKLFMDAGITKELVETRVAWFINHRRFRTRSFLLKIACVLGLIQISLCFLSIFTEPQYNLISARSGTTTNNDALVTNLPLVYWLIYLLFSLVIARTKDGFFIKWELALVGIGAFIFSFLYRIQSNSEDRYFKCSISSCALLFACCGWLWMIGCSVIFPLTVAYKDPRFSFTRCFRWAKVLRVKSHSASPSVNSGHSNTPEGEDFSSYHESHCDILEARELSPEEIARLKEVPLITFLSYPAGKTAFRAFVVREFSVENLLFVEAVAEYRIKAGLVKADFRVIYEQYIARSAASQVNLPASVTQKLKIRHEDPSDFNLNLCFDEAAKHVVKLMQRDSFKRFQSTPEWRAHVIAFNLSEPKLRPQPISPGTSDDSIIEMEPSTSSLAGAEPIFRATILDFAANPQVAAYESSTLSPSASIEPSTPVHERQCSTSPRSATYQELE